MDTLHRLSALSLLLGMFFFLYGLILFNLRMFLASMVFLWLGVSVENDIWKRQRAEYTQQPTEVSHPHTE